MSERTRVLTTHVDDHESDSCMTCGQEHPCAAVRGVLTRGELAYYGITVATRQPTAGADRQSGTHTPPNGPGANEGVGE